MKKTINIGTEIDLQDLLISRMLIQANSGGGKSALARTIIEEVNGMVPFIVLDYDGEYFTIKESCDNVLVIGGQYGDVKLSMQSVKLLPREIVSNGLSVVIDISDLENNEKVMYAKHFLEALMHLPKEMWTSYLVFIEEAHKLCGEQDKQASAGAVKDLMSRGRKMGLCGILLTQRISKLHKDAAAECNNKFVGRTSLDLDMDRVAKELGMTASSEFTRLSLRDLQPGEFYAYGTSIEPHHVHIVKVRKPKSKMVKAGLNINFTANKPTGKLLAMLEKLNELPADAEKELRTISDLQKEVARLKNEQKEKNVRQFNPIEQEEMQQLQSDLLTARNQLKDLRRIAASYEKALQTIDGITQKHVRDIITDGATVKEDGIIIPKSESIIPKREENVQKSPKLSAYRPNVANSQLLGKCSKAIITFLALYANREFSKAQVAVATGYSAGSGGFNNSLSELNQMGFILRSGKLQVNHDAMEDILSIVGEIHGREYSIETYRSNLGKCEGEIYDVLLRHKTSWFTKEQLSQATQTAYSSGSGGFNNSLSRLNTLELIERSNGKIRLNPELLEL